MLPKEDPEGQSQIILELLYVVFIELSNNYSKVILKLLIFSVTVLELDEVKQLQFIHVWIESHTSIVNCALIG